ncbi:MAG: LemA family protein [Terriglobia bacterium]
MAVEWVALAAGIAIIIAVAAVITRMKANLRRQAADLNKACSDIEVLLKRRNDDLPRLLQICRSYMPGEQNALRLITESRAAFLKAKNTAQKESLDAAVGRALHTLFIEVSKYPELKANNMFSQLKNELLEIGEQIDDRRDLFNDDARRFNRRLERPPAAWLAARMKLKRHELFQS